MSHIQNKNGPSSSSSSFIETSHSRLLDIIPRMWMCVHCPLQLVDTLVKYFGHSPSSRCCVALHSVLMCVCRLRWPWLAQFQKHAANNNNTNFDGFICRTSGVSLSTTDRAGRLFGFSAPPPKLEAPTGGQWNLEAKLCASWRVWTCTSLPPCRIESESSMCEMMMLIEFGRPFTRHPSTLFMATIRMLRRLERVHAVNIWVDSKMASVDGVSTINNYMAQSVVDKEFAE